MPPALWIRLGAGFMFLAVGLGAFGAHALKTRLSPDMLALTGVRKWGAVTPIGGVLFLAGWLIVLFSRGSSAGDRLWSCAPLFIEKTVSGNS